MDIRIQKTDVVVKTEKILELIEVKRGCHLGAIGDAKTFKNSLHAKMGEYT